MKTIFTHSTKLSTFFLFAFLSFSAIFAQTAPIAFPTGGFEIDGNLEANTQVPAAGDWLKGSASTGAFVFSSTGIAVNSATTYRFTDLYHIDNVPDSDNIFSGGKFNEDPNTLWSWTSGKAGGKGDINNVFIHLGVDPSNKQWLVFGSDRLVTNGTSYIDFEFFQKEIKTNLDGSFSLIGGRTNGDILLAVEYTGGGSIATVKFYQWNGSDYSLAVDPSTNAFGQTNDGDVNTITNGAFGLSSYSPYQFVEAAINISAFLELVDPCTAGGTFKTVLVKTKSAATPSAALDDFAGPYPVQLTLGTAKIKYRDGLLCKNEATVPVEFEGVPGGSFSASGGLIINSVTGEINVADSPIGTYTITYSFTTAGCPKWVTTQVTIYEQPVVSDQPNQTLCNTSTFTMTQTAPNVGTGLWTVVSGTATITNPSSPITTVTGLVAGTSATLKWTVTNGTCSAFDEVTIQNVVQPVVSNQPNQTLCNTSTFTMTQSAPNAGTGLWTLLSGSATITNPNSPTTTITGLAAGTSATVKWTVTNGTCSAFDEVTIQNDIQPIVSNQPNQNLCNTSTFTMTQSAPNAGTGLWTLVSGTATITDPSSPTTTVTGLTAGTIATLKWTVTNGTCSAFDEVIIQNDIQPIVSNQPNQTLCNTSTFTMTQSAPNAGTGLWTLLSGTAAIANPNSPTTTVTGLVAGTSATLKWTVTNGTCSAFDEVTIQNDIQPIVSDQPNQTLCNTSAFTMTQSAPNTGTGLWTMTSGTATITNPNSPTTTITGLTAGTSATVKWTVTNGTCSAFDEVTIQNDIQPIVSNQPNQTLCNTSTFTMTQSAPNAGTGLWTLLSGSATITNPNSPTTTITGLAAGTSATIKWTVTNGTCSAFDEVTIQNDIQPIVSNQPNQTLCNTSTFTMTQTTPNAGTGLWTLLSGTATITNPNSPTTTITGLVAGTSARLKWTVTNGTCSAFDEVIIQNDVQPIVSNQPNQTLCNTSTFTMTQTAPNAGTGVWTLLSGIATITNPNSPTTTVTGLVAGTSATLKWTVTNGTCSAFDEVTITVNPTAQVNNIANQIICNGGSTTAVNFSTTNIGGTTTYTWTNNRPSIGLNSTGSGNIASFAAINLGTSPITATITVTPYFTDDNVTCSGPSKSFTITVNPTLENPISGTNGPVCLSSSNDFVAPNGSDYSWTITGNGSISSNTDSKNVTVLSGTICAESYILTLNFKDINGCLAQSQKSVLVNDTNPPLLTIPNDKAFECSEIIPPVNGNDANATDDCDITPTVTFVGEERIDGNCPNSYTLKRTWEAKDDCGNTTTKYQTIKIEDKTAPTFEVPADKILSCEEDDSPTANGAGTVVVKSDNCDPNPTVAVPTDSDCFGNSDESKVDSGSNGDYFPFTVAGFDNLTAKDIEKVALAFETLKGKGRVEFTLVAPSGQGIVLVGSYCTGVNCDNPNSTKELYTPVFYPSSSPYQKWNNSDNIPEGDGNFEPNGTSSTNNVNGLTSYVTNFDSLTGPMNGTWFIHARKDNDENGAIGDISFKSVCLKPSMGSCPKNDLIVRHWSVSDACGNTTKKDQVIRIIDTKAPIFTTGPSALDQTITSDSNCKALIPNYTETIAVNDNCSPYESLTITQSPIAGTEIGSGITTVIITVKDECGNEATYPIKLTVPNYIIANDDTGSAINGVSGGISFTNVLANDLLNCKAVSSDDITLSFISSTNSGVTLDGSNVVVAPGTPNGTYTLTYQICENSNPTNCDQAIVTVPVYAPSINITKEGTYQDTNGDGITNIGDTIAYSFVVTNDGSSILTNVIITDPSVTVTGGPIPTFDINAIDSTTFSAVHAITQEDINTGYVYNLATAAGTPPMGADVEDDSSDPTPCTTCPINPECPECTITPLTQDPSINITKDGTYVDTNQDRITNVGDVVSYNFVITNTGNVTLTNVTVTDNNAVITGGPIVSLAVGATDSATFSGSHAITQEDIDAGYVYNLATVTAKDPKDNPVPPDTSSDPTPCKTCPIDPECPECTITPLTQNPALAVIKTTTTASYSHIGDIINYVIVVQNTGNVTLHHVVVKDPLTGLDSLIEVLAPGASSEYTQSYTIALTDLIKRSVSNIATADGLTPNETPINASDEEIVNAVFKDIDAQDDTYNIIQGNSNVLLGNIIDNDLLNGVKANIGDLTYTIIDVFHPNLSFDSVATLSVQTSIPVGQYIILYRICETLNPENCDIATITINVTRTPIDAVDDFAGPIVKVDQMTSNVLNVFANDKLNGVLLNPSDVVLTTVTPNPYLQLNPDGSVDVLPNAPAGTQTLTYQICEILNPENCDQAVVSIIIRNPLIATPTLFSNECNPINLGNILANVKLDGNPVTLETVNFSITTGNNSNISIDNLGDVSISDGIAPGTYEFTYEVCEKANPENCTSNTLSISISSTIPLTITSSACNADSSVITLSSLLPTETPTDGTWVDNNNTGLLNNGTLSTIGVPLGNYVFEYKFFVGECPRSIFLNMNINDDCRVLGCGVIHVFNAFSPNGDGINEYFKIENIDDVSCYPDNSVEIYNRWGVLVYEARGYNNGTIVFNGTSEGRTTIKQSEGLPTGTYFYVLNYSSVDDNGQIQTNSKDGYLYLTR